MKQIPFLLLAAISVGSLRAQEVDPPIPHAPAPSSEPSTRLLGKLPDGTPPPPQPPKPGFVAPAEKILSTDTFLEGGRTITVHEIAPITLPPPPEVIVPAEPSPEFRQRLAELSASRPKIHHLSIGATVYREKDKPTRTVVRYWSFEQNQLHNTVVFWSSADFSLLAGLPGFVTSDGRQCSLMMAWGVRDAHPNAALLTKHGRTYTPPVIPELPAGKATFTITSGTPSAKALTDIQSLHDLYNNEYEKLLTAYQGREQARLAREAELKAHPPQPKDIILNHWRVQPAKQTQTQEEAR